MTTQNHDEIRRLFDLVLEADHAERQAILLRECGDDVALSARLSAMVKAVEDDEFMADATHDAIAGLETDATELAPASSEAVGFEIGRYKLLEKLGEGGFGVVWAAEQREPVKRRVALKIIKLGMDTQQVIARFEAERQALALMDHPNIAKVLDAGATDSGRPYFVMELVKGIPIVEYADSERLDTEARLNLFGKVCNAIQHAHQKGIIHRDIKPSNVLVTLHDGAPVPKVIDFGIAKATNQELTELTIYTQHRQMIGTPAYMSPEQAEMSGLDIDTRSDIYSLGVLLYELLTGTTPFTHAELKSAGFEGMLRLIREVEPHKPSTRLSSLGESAGRSAEQRRSDTRKLGILLRGDLDWIVMKCLEKDRTRRYETANALAADVVRHLLDEPVLAGPPTATYKLWKFVRRHRGRVAAAALVAFALVLGAIGTTVGLLWALSESDRAARAAMAERQAKEEAQASEAAAIKGAEELQLVVDYYSEQFSWVDVQTLGLRLRRSISESASEEDRAALDQKLAKINFTDIGLASINENVFQPALRAIDTQFAEQPLVRAKLFQTLAISLQNLGLLEAAVEPQETALQLRRQHLGDEAQLTCASITSLGRLHLESGRISAADTLFREALALRRATLGDEHEDTLVSLGNVAEIHLLRDELDEAEPLFKAALEALGRTKGPEHPAAAEALADWARLRMAQGKLEEAETLYREVLDIARRTRGEEHPRALGAMNNLADVLDVRGKYAEAEQLMRSVVASHQRAQGDAHPVTITARSNLAAVLQSMGQIEEASRIYQEVLPRYREIYGLENPETQAAINNVGGVLLQQGRPHEAAPYFREALALGREFYGDEHRTVLGSMQNLAAALQQQGALEEAEALFRESVELHRRALGDEHPLMLIAMHNLAILLDNRGNIDEAERLYREVLEISRRVFGEQHPSTANVMFSLGRLCAAQGRLSEAEPLYRGSLAGYRASLGPQHMETLMVAFNVGEILRDLGKLDESEAMFIEISSLPEETFAPGHHQLKWTATNSLAGVYMIQKRYDKAEPLILVTREWLANNLSPEHPLTQSMTRELVHLYTSWHEIDSEAGHDASAAEWQALLPDADE